MFSDVGQPHHVGTRGTELALHEVVSDCWPWCLARRLSTLLRGGGPDPVGSTELVDPRLAHHVAQVLHLVGQEPVAESRIIVVKVDELVHQVGVVEITLTDGVLEPAVVGLGSDSEHPAGQPHREALGGQITDQRVFHFGRASLAK